MPFRINIPSGLPPPATFGVGQNKQPLSFLRRADFRRSKESFRNPEAQLFQLASDLAISEVDMIGDVLQKHPFRLALPDDFGEMRPQMAGIVRALALARDREWLARISTSEDIHCSTPRAAVKGSNVVPDRCRIQGLVFHPRHEGGCSICFPLDVTNSAIPGTGDGKPEVDSTGSGTERQAEEGITASGRYSQLIHGSQRGLCARSVKVRSVLSNTASCPVNCCQRCTATST